MVQKNKVMVWLGLIFFLLNATLFLSGATMDNKKKFQFELFGGLALFQPKDLNLISQAEKDVRYFLYDQYYDYLVDHGNIGSWTQSGSDQYCTIKSGRSMGGRLKYRLSESLAVSLGLKSLFKTSNADPSYQYEAFYSRFLRYVDARTYDTNRLEVKAIAPLIGVHLDKKLTGSLKIGGFISGGPLFGNCQHLTSYISQWREVTSTYSILLHEEVGKMTEKGSGVGMVVEGGLNVNLELGSSFGFFVEAGYAYQKIWSLSGNGSARRGNVTTTWTDAEWSMKQEVVISPYLGRLPVAYPTNSWRQGEQPARDFALDLSGLECRVGLMFRF